MNSFCVYCGGDHAATTCPAFSAPVPFVPYQAFVDPRVDALTERIAALEAKAAPATPGKYDPKPWQSRDAWHDLMAQCDDMQRQRSEARADLALVTGERDKARVFGHTSEQQHFRTIAKLAEVEAERDAMAKVVEAARAWERTKAGSVSEMHAGKAIETALAELDEVKT